MTAPAGWYDDGSGTGRQRYWDGAQWTEHFHPPLTPAPPAYEPEAAAAPAQAGVVDPQAYQAQASVAPQQATASATQEVWSQPGAQATAPVVTTQSADPYATAPAQSSGVPTWVWAVVGAVVALGLVVGALFLTGVIGGGDSSASPGTEQAEGANSGDSADSRDGDDSGGAAGLGAADSHSDAAIEAAYFRYLDASNAFDCDEFWATTTENFRTSVFLTDCESLSADVETIEGWDDLMEETQPDVEVVSIDVSGDTAVLRIRTAYDYLGEVTTTEFDFTFVYEDGTWKADEFDISGAVSY